MIIMFPHEGNQYAKKLTSHELRVEAYKQYCAHLAKGKSKRSWTFIHEDCSLRSETMEKYIKENPLEFDPEKITLAMSQGFARWEQVVEDSAEGSNKDANTASLQMLMRNKYKWDKNDQVFDDDSSNEVKENQTHILKQIKNYQSNSSFPVA